MDVHTGLAKWTETSFVFFTNISNVLVRAFVLGLAHARV